MLIFFIWIFRNLRKVNSIRSYCNCDILLAFTTISRGQTPKKVTFIPTLFLNPSFRGPKLLISILPCVCYFSRFAFTAIRERYFWAGQCICSRSSSMPRNKGVGFHAFVSGITFTVRALTFYFPRHAGCSATTVDFSYTKNSWK